MITLIVTYCLVLNNSLCRQLEMIPEDYRSMTSVTDCLRGGVIGSMTFTIENAEWSVKGWHCAEQSVSPEQAAINDRLHASVERELP